ncbi:hypothetical protein WOC75_26820, partial [Klebsiella pneumoniae]|uniref:hypothetical protein n=1 Tax=Klebsiella pneumoniae TaxID=573 RepID=UPI0030F24925
PHQPPPPALLFRRSGRVLWCGGICPYHTPPPPPPPPPRAGIFPANPCGYILAPRLPVAAIFSFLHSATLAACYDVRPPLCANPGPAATPEDDR